MSTYSTVRHRYDPGLTYYDNKSGRTTSGFPTTRGKREAAALHRTCHLHSFRRPHPEVSCFRYCYLLLCAPSKHTPSSACHVQLASVSCHGPPGLASVSTALRTELRQERVPAPWMRNLSWRVGRRIRRPSCHSRPPAPGPWPLFHTQNP